MPRDTGEYRFGGYLILGRSASGNLAAGTTLTAAERLADAQSVQLPYLIVAAILVVLAMVIARFPLPAMGGGAGDSAKRAAKAERAGLSLWRHRNLVFGVPAIFIYLIAEIGVSNLFINFVSQPEIGDLTHTQASHYLFLLWGGMMIGRFLGSYLMQVRSAETILAGAALAAFTVMLVATFATGSLAMASACPASIFCIANAPTSRPTIIPPHSRNR